MSRLHIISDGCGISPNGLAAPQREPSASKIAVVSVLTVAMLGLSDTRSSFFAIPSRRSHSLASNRPFGGPTSARMNNAPSLPPHQLAWMQICTSVAACAAIKLWMDV